MSLRHLLCSSGIAASALVAIYWGFVETGSPWAAIAIGTALVAPMRALAWPGRARAGRRLLIVGQSPIARKLIDEVEAHPALGYTIVGVIADRPPAELPASRFPVLSSLQELKATVHALRPDRIIIGLADRRGRLPLDDLLESRLSGIDVEDAVDEYERITGKLAIEALTPGGLIASHGFRKSDAISACQRVLSCAAAAIGLILLAPLLGLTALAIKLDSDGPIFFRQDRVGMSGRPFELLKFRTMTPAAGPTSEWAADNLDRITPVGRWLRKARLDELPQLVNILRGDMNLVGPRPHPVSNFKLFMETIPYYGLRALVRPGLTGWAQVRYRYANNLTEETEKMRYDLYYIKHLSLRLDLRIVVSTLAIILSGRSLAPGQLDRSEALDEPVTLWRPATPPTAAVAVPGPARSSVARPIAVVAHCQSSPIDLGPAPSFRG